MPNVIEITNPRFLQSGAIAFGLTEQDGEHVARIAWRDYETAEIRASTEARALELVGHYVRRA